MMYIEMLGRNGSYAIVCCNEKGQIQLYQDGYAKEELPCYEKAFTGTAKFFQAI